MLKRISRTFWESAEYIAVLTLFFGAIIFTFSLLATAWTTSLISLGCVCLGAGILYAQSKVPEEWTGARERFQKEMQKRAAANHWR